MTQIRFAALIGASLTKLYRMETREEDTTTVEQIRACYAYARKQGLRWPRGLLQAIVEEE